MAQVLANGLVVPGGYSYPPLSPDSEKVFDFFHPKHAGHTKVALPVIGLRYEARCVPCAQALSVSMLAALIHNTQQLGGGSNPLTEFKGVDCVPPDDRYPHQCTRCKGPAYVGAYDIDCKNRCS